MTVSPIAFYAISIALLISGLLALLFFLRYRRLNKEMRECKRSQNGLEYLNNSMLEITQAVVGTEKPVDLYKMILEKTIDAIPSANVGSVMVKDDEGLFHCIAQQGFDKEKIDSFSIPLEETILWKYTKGRIERSVIIEDVTAIEDLEIKPLTVDPEEWSIRSTITVPLFSDNEIEGIVSIDSKEVDAFNSDDLKAMEYVRSNIEVALQKFHLYREMVHLSRFDSLTKANNRNHFMEQFSAILNRAERYKEKFSLLIFDINDLKKVNDTHGHIAGDKILQKYAETTMKLIRKTDTFARWGGDEFMAIFYEMKEEEIEEKINNIREYLKTSPVKAGSKDLQVSFSYGHAFYPVEGENFDQLLKTADNRMYVNKRKMKNQPPEG